MESDIILYSTNCPQCKVLKAKLDNAQITYEICTDINKMLELGLTFAPALGVEGKLLNFSQAIEWVRRHNN